MGLLNFLFGSENKTSYEDHILPYTHHNDRTLTYSDCFYWLDQKVVVYLQRFERPQIGTVKYIGSDHRGKLCAGIEFDVYIGGMSGKVNGVKLFKCKQGHGLLVPVEYVCLLEVFARGGNTMDGHLRQQPVQQDVHRVQSVPNLSQQFANSPSLTDFAPCKLPTLSIGDNVVWLGDDPKSGIVKWIGRAVRSNTAPVKAWVEMDDYQGFANTGIDLGVNFGCAAGRGKLISVDELILLENFLPNDNTQHNPQLINNEEPRSTVESGLANLPSNDVPVSNDLIDLSDPIQDQLNNLSVPTKTSVADKNLSEIVKSSGVGFNPFLSDIIPGAPLAENSTRDEVNVDYTTDGVLCQKETNLYPNSNPIADSLMSKTPGSKESEENLMPPFIVPPIDIVEFFKTQGVRGIQGQRNSCYIDVVLFSMFAFTDIFDKYFLTNESIFSKSSDSPIAKSAKRILAKEIVNPLRQDFYCPAIGVNHLRELMMPISDKLDGAFMDVEEFMLILFDKVFQLQEFIAYDNGVKDYLHQINLGDVVLPSVITVKQCLELSMKDYNLCFKDIPSPAFILEIPRHHSGVIQSSIVVPNLTIDLKPFVADSVRSPTVMNLVSVICINDFHFVAFVKSGKGPLSHWVLFDSNPSEERPKVEIVANMGEWLESLEHTCRTSPEKVTLNKHKLPPNVSRLLSDIYVCIYCPNDENP